MADEGDLIDMGVAQSVNEIWTRYDADGQGRLDKETIKQVMLDWLKKDNAEAELEEEDFE